MKLLCLPEWYPNMISPFNGDFLQRHIRAVGLFHDVHVIHVVRDREGRVTKDTKVEKQVSANISERIIYYYSPVFSFSLMDKFFSFLKFRKLYRDAIRNYIRQYGKPDLVHVHIAFRAGLVTGWIKKKWGIPYVISEHWTGFLPEAKEKFSDLPFYFRFLWRKLIRDALTVSVVSSYLGDCLQKILPGIEFTVIPNVVDTTIFKSIAAEETGITRFIHISILNYQKNPEDLLKAFALVKEDRSDFHLSIVGPYREDLALLVNELQLQSNVDFHPEVPQAELVRFIQQSHALILYSRYETFGCVIIEAQTCGVPVILSDITVMHENAEEGFNAVFAENENPGALSEKLSWFMNNRTRFNASAIANRAASTYNYKKIGSQFCEWYNTALNKS